MAKNNSKKQTKPNNQYYNSKATKKKLRNKIIATACTCTILGCGIGAGAYYGIDYAVNQSKQPVDPPAVEDTVTPDVPTTPDVPVTPVEPETPVAPEVEQDTREYPINLKVYQDTAINKDLELDLSTATFYNNIDSTLTETEKEIFEMNNLLILHQPLPFDNYAIMLDKALKPYSGIEVFINGYDLSFNYLDDEACVFGIFKIKDNFVQVALPLGAGPQDFLSFNVSKNLDDFKDAVHTLRYVEVDSLNIDIICHS